MWGVREGSSRMFPQNGRVRAIVVAWAALGVGAAAACADPPGGNGVKWTVEASNPDDNVTAVRVSGTPYQMGWWYGHLLAGEIRENLDDGIAWAIAETGMSQEELAQMASVLWAFRMGPFVPQDFHDEMQGIVDGAAEAEPNVTPEILLLEVIFYHVMIELSEFNCTSIGAVAPATHDGRLIQIRVLDFDLGTGCQDNPVITVYRPDDGPAYCNVGFAGLIGSLAGINSEHIAVTEVGLDTVGADLERLDDPNVQALLEGIPMALLLKKVLAQAQPEGPTTALDKALQIIQTGPRTTNYGYGVGDGTLPDSKGLGTTHAQCYIYGAGEFISFNDPGEPNTIWEPDLPMSITLPAVPGVAYLPHDADETLDLIDTSSPNYIGPIDPNSAMQIARRVAMDSNLMNVVFDGQDLKLWAAYARDSHTSHRAATREFVAFDFAAAANAYTIDVTCKKPNQGSVTLSPDPSDPNIPDYGYPSGTEVTLTAEPNGGKVFKTWKIYDPNHPGDANYMVTDANNPITIVMNGDYDVTAVFKCGGGVGEAMPPLVIGAAILALVSRRARRAGR